MRAPASVAITSPDASKTWSGTSATAPSARYLSRSCSVRASYSWQSPAPTRVDANDGLGDAAETVQCPGDGRPAPEDRGSRRVRQEQGRVEQHGFAASGRGGVAERGGGGIPSQVRSAGSGQLDHVAGGQPRDCLAEHLHWTAAVQPQRVLLLGDLPDEPRRRSEPAPDLTTVSTLQQADPTTGHDEDGGVPQSEALGHCLEQHSVDPARDGDRDRHNAVGDGGIEKAGDFEPVDTELFGDLCL